MVSSYAKRKISLLADIAYDTAIFAPSTTELLIFLQFSKAI
jgi:hypothetical protein